MIKLLMLFILRSFKTPKLTKYLIPLILTVSQLSAEPFTDITYNNCSIDSLNRIDPRNLIRFAREEEQIVPGYDFRHIPYFGALPSAASIWGSENDRNFADCSENNKRLGTELLSAKILKIPETCADYEFSQVEIYSPLGFTESWNEVLVINNLNERRANLLFLTREAFAGTYVQNTYRTTLSIEAQGQLRIDHFPSDQELIKITSLGPIRVTCKRYYSNAELEQIKIQDQERAAAEEEQKRQQEIKDEVNRQQRLKERAEEAYREKIYRNCIADKLSNTSNQQFVRAVQEICNEISLSPNFWQRFWYDTMGG